jgi:hypothetical protein
MKAADHDRDLFSSKSQGDIRSPAKLVGLHSHQADEYPLAGPAVEAEDPVQRHLVHGLIHHMNSQVYLAEHTPLPNIFGQAVQTSEAVAGHHSTPVTDDKAFVVVLGRPDQENMKDKRVFGGLHT